MNVAQPHGGNGQEQIQCRRGAGGVLLLKSGKSAHQPSSAPTGPPKTGHPGCSPLAGGQVALGSGSFLLVDDRAANHEGEVGHSARDAVRMACWAAGYLGTGDARLVEGHAAAIRRASAPSTRQQDRRSYHRLSGHQASGTAADVEQAPTWLSGDGISRRGTARIW